MGAYATCLLVVFSMDYSDVAKACAIAGLLLSVAGVLLLFIYGMPYRVETKGKGSVNLRETDQAEIQEDKRYRRRGYWGLAMVVAGTALQMAGVIMV